MSQAGRFFLAVVLVIAALALTILHVKSQEIDRAAIVAQFFKDAKKARLANGQTFNCCDPAEAVGVQVTGADPFSFRATVIDPRRHRNATVGKKITAGRDRLAVWPQVPSFMGEIMFLQSHGEHVYCFFPQAGG